MAEGGSVRRRSVVGDETGYAARAVVSPLLANVYLHYAFDLWGEAWRTKVAKGDVIIVRYADDLVLGFQHRAEAERFPGGLRRRSEWRPSSTIKTELQRRKHHRTTDVGGSLRRSASLVRAVCVNAHVRIGAGAISDGRPYRDS